MSDIPKLHPDFEDFLVALCDASADFVVVGAYAMSFHGLPRATGDIDVFVRPTPANAGRVWTALVAFGAPIEATGLTIDDLSTPGVVYQMGVAPRRIDLLTNISGVSFDEVWSTKETMELGERAVHFIGRSALVKNKRASGRPKDLVDVEILEKRR